MPSRSRRSRVSSAGPASCRRRPLAALLLLRRLRSAGHSARRLRPSAVPRARATVAEDDPPNTGNAKTSSKQTFRRRRSDSTTRSAATTPCADVLCGRAGSASALEARVHEALALVALQLLGARLFVARGHPLLLLLLRGTRARCAAL